MYNNGYGGGYVNNGGYAGNGYGGSYGGYGGGDDYDDIGMDLSQTETYNGSTLLPRGEYPVIIKHAERRQGTKKPYINVTYVVTEGKYKGCHLFDRFFLWSDKPEFAKQRFKALRFAIGLNPNIGGRISELPDKEFLAGVKIKQKRDEHGNLMDDYENEINGFFPLNPPMQQGTYAQGQPMQAAQAAAPQAPQRPAQATQHPAQAAAAPARPQPAQAPQRPTAQAAQAQNVQPSEYAQDMSNGPAPQEATFPTPEKGSIDDTPF